MTRCALVLGTRRARPAWQKLSRLAGAEQGWQKILLTNLQKSRISKRTFLAKRNELRGGALEDQS